MEGAICYGYDFHSDILQASRLVASVFGVEKSCFWNEINFNNKTETDNIENNFDICICLSMMASVKNKNNLIEVLSRQKTVLYEGHDSELIEIDRLKQAGFSKIEKLSVCDRGRSLFLAKE